MDTTRFRFTGNRDPYDDLRMPVIIEDTQTGRHYEYYWDFSDSDDDTIDDDFAYFIEEAKEDLADRVRTDYPFRDTGRDTWI